MTKDKAVSYRDQQKCRKLSEWGKETLFCCEICAFQTTNKLIFDEHKCVKNNK
jgi:hypothetical protein